MQKWIIRHETREDGNLYAVWENADGDRWYAPVIVDGEAVF